MSLYVNGKDNPVFSLLQFRWRQKRREKKLHFLFNYAYVSFQPHLKDEHKKELLWITSQACRSTMKMD